MNQTASRLLKLLSLLQARRDWPGNELADRLEVSNRPIRRDIERLRQPPAGKAGRVAICAAANYEAGAERETRDAYGARLQVVHEGENGLAVARAVPRPGHFTGRVFAEGHATARLLDERRKRSVCR